MDTPSHSTVSLSTLLCQETEKCLDEGDEEHQFFSFTDYASSASDSAEDEYVQILLQREPALAKPRNPHSALLEGCTRSARLDAIDYILRTRALFGFRFQSAYLSALYFDRFLSKRSIDSQKRWTIELLSVACLSLAAKLEECRVPGLSELQDVNLMDHQPSAIASAAVLVTLDQRLTRKQLELKINAIPLSRFLDIEDAFTCYTIMQQLELAKIGMSNLIVSPGLSQINLRWIEALRNAPSANSSIITKRKRLTFNDNDQNYDLPEKKRDK
ncbi:hypothetical protein Ancab_016511 [Ancistrocladus abbreviatus]